MTIYGIDFGGGNGSNKCFRDNLSNKCSPSSHIPVQLLPNLGDADRDHFYITPDNKVWVSNYNGDGWIELTACCGGTIEEEEIKIRYKLILVSWDSVNEYFTFDTSEEPQELVVTPRNIVDLFEQIDSAGLRVLKALNDENESDLLNITVISKEDSIVNITKYPSNDFQHNTGKSLNKFIENLIKGGRAGDFAYIAYANGFFHGVNNKLSHIFETALVEVRDKGYGFPNTVTISRAFPPYDYDEGGAVGAYTDKDIYYRSPFNNGLILRFPNE